MVQDNVISNPIMIESCDCLGECGYGPNVMMITQNEDSSNNDKILKNHIRGQEAIYQVLGLTPSQSVATTTTSVNEQQEGKDQ